MFKINRSAFERLLNSKFYIFLKFAIAFFLIYWLLKDIDFIKTKAVFISADKYGLIKYTLILFLIIIVSSIKYYLILLGIKGKISFFKIIKVNWIGLFLNNFVPGGLGMDAYRFIIFKETIAESNLPKLIVLLICDKILGALVFLFLAFAFGFELFIKLFSSYILISGIVLFIMLVLVFIIYFVKKQRVLEFINDLSTIGIMPVLVLVLSQLFIVLLILEAYQSLFYAIHIEASYHNLLKLVPIISLGDYIPISVNGIGIREGLSVFLFDQINISSENTLVHTFLGRILSIIVSLFGGLLYLRTFIAIKK